MKATFCFSKMMPSGWQAGRGTTVAIFDTRISVCSSTRPLRITVANRSWLMADAPASARPETTARMVAKATAEMKPRNRSPPTALARWIAAMFEPPLIAAIDAGAGGDVRRVEKRRVGRDEQIAPKPMMKVRM